ncbi:MAG TPA: alpha/beta hydrolase [bacterium]|nr:alpha/beta hydrolase [bacterium]
MSMNPTPPQSHIVEANGLRLHHLDWGTADKHPIVMLHGIRLHAYVWGDFCRRFRASHHVLTLDQRGHGDSTWAPGTHYHLHDYYEDLHAVMEARGLEQVTLIGHSLGARVCLLYSYLHPERVRRLVLVDMGAGLPHIGPRDFSRITETPPPQDFASHAEAIEYLRGILSIGPRELIEESVVHGMRELPSGRFTWKYDPVLGGPPQPRPDAREWDLWEAARAIDCPTLLLHGEYSKVVTPDIISRMQVEMADLRTELVERAGHALFTDQPQVFAESVTRFLQETAD